VSGAVMRNYIFRRLLVAIPSLLIASLIVFTLPRLIPGDVVQLMLQEKAYGKDLEDLRAKLGLNRPIHEQYVEWLLAVGHARDGNLYRKDLTKDEDHGRYALTPLDVPLPVTGSRRRSATGGRATCRN
jgi:hypothetical protein